jgi:ubiquinone/menaquinone biosynthesis C-methylase UbiE
VKEAVMDDRTVQRELESVGTSERELPVGRHARRLVERARPIGPSDRILDLACGTGVVARILSERLGAAAQVAAVDADPAAIAHARAGAPAVTWVEGEPSALPFSDGSFELVLCQRLESLGPELPLVLREVHRVLTPAGRFISLVEHRAHTLGASLLAAGFTDIRMEKGGTEAPPDPLDRIVLSARRG